MATATVEVKGGSLYLAGRPVAVVVDSKGGAWFRGSDVVAAAGYADVNRALSRRVPEADRQRLKDISGCSATNAHPQSVFVSWNGLTLFIRDVFDSVTVSSTLATMSSFVESLRRSSLADGSLLLVNGQSVTFVVDTEKHAWFKANDLAKAVGLASSAASKYVTDADRKPFNAISVHDGASPVTAHARNVFFNQNGLIAVLRRSRHSPHVVEANLAFEPASAAPVWKLQLAAVYQLFKTLHSPLYRHLLVADAKNELQQITVTAVDSQLKAPPYRVAVVKRCDSGALWQRDAPQLAKGKLLETIQSVLADWASTSTSYNLPLDKLTRAITLICASLTKISRAVDELASRGNSAQSTPPPLSADRVKLLSAQSADNSGRAEWIYVASTERYAALNVFKVGSTTRLARRIGHYQTGRIESDFYRLLHVRRAFDSKRADNMIRHFLDDWSQKVTKGSRTYTTEMYTMNFRNLCDAVDVIVDIYEQTVQTIRRFLILADIGHPDGYRIDY